MTISTSQSSGREPFNILFTCVGRRVALMRAFREALAELGLPGKLVGADAMMAAPGMYAVDVPEIVPEVRSLHYIPYLKELVARHGIRLLIPVTDLDLRTLSRHQGEFAALGCTVMISPLEIVNVCRNKLSFARLLHKAGLRGIRTESLESFFAAPFYPCFVKPIYGSAAIGTGRVRDEREMQAHIATFGDQLMVQEWLPGQEYTMDVFRRRDGVVCAVVPRQRLIIRSGEVEKGLTVNDPELIEATLRLVERLNGAWGVINAQCRRGEDGAPRFFEANLRFGGGATLSIAAGVNLPKMVIQEALGEPVEPMVGRFTDKLLMLRYEEAFYTQVDDPAGLPGYRQPKAK